MNQAMVQIAEADAHGDACERQTEQEPNCPRPNVAPVLDRGDTDFADRLRGFFVMLARRGSPQILFEERCIDRNGGL